MFANQKCFTFAITMKKQFLFIFLILVFSSISLDVAAQCSICTKTAMQLGTKPAQGLNTGILYLMSIPYIAIGVVGYSWWRSQKNNSEEE